MSNVYSPTQTKTFHRCPTLRMLEREGWEDPYAGKKRIAGAIGSAVSAGLEQYNKARMYGKLRPGVIDYAHALNVLKADLAALDRMVLDEDQAAKAPGQVIDVLTYYASHDPIPANWTILGAEIELPGSGRSRPDLIVWDREGPRIVDYKCKMRLEERYREKTEAAYTKDWQMQHYCYFASQFYGRPVLNYSICLITLEPKLRIDMLPFTFTKEQLDRWIVQAEITWTRMHDTDISYALSGGMETKTYVEMSSNHFDQYGKCPMFDACFTYELDRELMQAAYIQIPRRSH